MTLDLIEELGFYQSSMNRKESSRSIGLRRIGACCGLNMIGVKSADSKSWMTKPTTRNFETHLNCAFKLLSGGLFVYFL